jgi:hypothetical protein
MESNVYVYRLEYGASSGNCIGNSIVTEMDLVKKKDPTKNNSNQTQTHIHTHTLHQSV